MATGGTVIVTNSSTTPQQPDTGRTRIFVNSSSNLCSIDDAGTVRVYSVGITPEEVQDIVGAMLQDTSTINATYDDTGNVIYFDVIPGGVNHNLLLNYVANQHIDHSTVNITAGTGLSGGGDITTSRTLNIANTAVSAGSYGSSSSVGTFTVNAQGQLTAAANASITPASIGAQPLDSDLTAVAGLTGTGLIARTGTGTATTRTVTAGTGISVANGDGVSGNPTVTNTDLGSTAVTTHVGLADPHTQYTLETRTISAGAGLTGGGDLTADRTISMPNVGTAGTYGNATNYPIITTDAQGRVTTVTTQLVSAVFGSEAENFSDLTTATTTSTAFSSAASFTTASVPAGTYRIQLFWAWNINATNNDARFQPQIDGVNAGPEMRIEVSEAASQSFWTTGFLYATFGSVATHTIALTFAVETGGTTLNVTQVRAEFWRVS
jgi:hypothetical protein